MELYGRSKQIKCLVLKIDLMIKPKYGELWAKFVPDIASAFPGLRTLSIIYIEIHERFRSYDSTSFYDKVPWDESPTAYRRTLQNLQKSLRGGRFVLYFDGRRGDGELVMEEMHEEAKLNPGRSWGDPWPWNLMGLPMLKLNAEEDEEKKKFLDSQNWRILLGAGGRLRWRVRQGSQHYSCLELCI